ncbi:hypothetical protein NM208_g5605 [Fusarium decemcellulare]|uniref:Uncharacterized protein n=1 Tax=Fusarium decemcellulare TaxID=57161 RepID=A0ACC1SGB1_9HYPO|nr:hypothetical protein NM208_g5605 [Fusarium decemcellulare]
MSSLPNDIPLPPAVQALIDKEEIRTVIYRFCRGSDRRIRDLVQSVYHPDAVDNHGSYNGPAKDFYDFVNSVPPVLCSHHHIGQTLIDLGEDGSTANAETYCTATTIDEVDGQHKWTTFLVRYIDKFEKRDGEWKITHRFVAFDGITDNTQMNYLPKSSLGTRNEGDYSRKIFKD